MEDLRFQVSKLPWRWLRRVAVLLSLPLIAIAYIPYVLVMGVVSMLNAYARCMATLVRSVPKVWTLP